MASSPSWLRVRIVESVYSRQWSLFADDFALHASDTELVLVGDTSKVSLSNDLVEKITARSESVACVQVSARSAYGAGIIEIEADGQTNLADWINQRLHTPSKFQRFLRELQGPMTLLKTKVAATFSQLGFRYRSRP